MEIKGEFCLKQEILSCTQEYLHSDMSHFFPEDDDDDEVCYRLCLFLSCSDWILDSLRFWNSSDSDVFFYFSFDYFGTS